MQNFSLLTQMSDFGVRMSQHLHRSDQMSEQGSVVFVIVVLFTGPPVTVALMSRHQQKIFA